MAGMQSTGSGDFQFPGLPMGDSGGGGFDWTSILGGLGGMFAGGLFGGGGNGGAQYRGDEVKQLQGLSGVGDKYKQFADMNLRDYYKRSGEFNGALNSRIKYDLTDFGTDQNDAADLNQQMRQTNAAFANIVPQMAARNAVSGLNTADTGGGPNSTVAGQNAYIAAQQANAVANAQNQLAQHKIAARQAQGSDLINILTGARGQASSGAMAGLNGVSGIYDDLASRYGSLADYMDRRKDGKDAARNQMYGDLIKTIPTFFA